jgi:hypothetical protein
MAACHSSFRTSLAQLPTSRLHAHNRRLQVPKINSQFTLVFCQFCTKMTLQPNLTLTSGAKYSGVPQKVFVVVPYRISSLHNPKSAILIWPSLSRRRFSNYSKSHDWIKCWKQAELAISIKLLFLTGFKEFSFYKSNFNWVTEEKKCVLPLDLYRLCSSCVSNWSQRWFQHRRNVLYLHWRHVLVLSGNKVRHRWHTQSPSRACIYNILQMKR